MSKLVHSIKVDGKKEFLKYCFDIEARNAISGSCFICFSNTSKYSGKII